MEAMSRRMEAAGKALLRLRETVEKKELSEI